MITRVHLTLHPHPAQDEDVVLIQGRQDCLVAPECQPSVRSTLDKAGAMLYAAASTENSVPETPAHKRKIWSLP
jgi:hypothetical protein